MSGRNCGWANEEEVCKRNLVSVEGDGCEGMEEVEGNMDGEGRGCVGVLIV